MRLEDLLRAFEERVAQRFYGKYEGVVTDNVDPLEIGRVRARVPAVFGEDVETGWAQPCPPYGGGKDRGFLFVPEVGDAVWIEFAAGDISRPLWTGAIVAAPGGESEAPTCDGAKAGPLRHVLRTKAGHRLFFDDEGGIVVLAHGGDKAEIRITSDGEVIVKAEKIKLGDGAQQAVVLGDDFMQLFNSHTHPTGVGPSGPPTQPMQAAHLSKKTFTE